LSTHRCAKTARLTGTGILALGADSSGGTMADDIAPTWLRTIQQAASGLRDRSAPASSFPTTAPAGVEVGSLADDTIIRALRAGAVSHAGGQHRCRGRVVAQQWRQLGAALRQIQAVPLPPQPTRMVGREAFRPTRREFLANLEALVATAAADDPVAGELAGFWRARQDVVDLFTPGNIIDLARASDTGRPGP
jgi:hypothetical protein